MIEKKNSFGAGFSSQPCLNPDRLFSTVNVCMTKAWGQFSRIKVKKVAVPLNCSVIKMNMSMNVH